MKKQYIRPESRLFAINLEENIASSENLSSGLVEGRAMIFFTHIGLGECRKYYTDDLEAVVTVSGDDFWSYWDELYMIGETKPSTYHKCFKNVRPT